tara:strand:- start:332 stop:484 length:153 start_codon:yes stop_codon:yes gene_type:complete
LQIYFQLSNGIGNYIIGDFVIGEDSLKLLSGSLGVAMAQSGKNTKIYSGG